MPKRRKAPATAELPYVFARGFIATALLTAVQDRSAADGRRRVLCRAAQGGAALAAGTLAAEALAGRRYGLALAATTVGAAAVLAAEHLLNNLPDPGATPLADPRHSNDDKETGLGQEIAQEG